MKKFSIITMAALLTLSCMSCVTSADEEFTEDVKRVDILTRGIISVVTVNGVDTPVSVDSVKIANASTNVNVDDSVNMYSQQVDFRRFKPSISVISEQIVRREQFYAVKQLDCLLTLSMDNLSLPLYFSRQIVVSIDETGNEYTPRYSFSLEYISVNYLGSENMVTYDESHLKSYFNLLLGIYDNGNAIGTLATTVSFYTLNPPITFGAECVDWENEDYCF